jgi:hypothetical protein
VAVHDFEDRPTPELACAPSGAIQELSADAQSASGRTDEETGDHPELGCGHSGLVRGEGHHGVAADRVQSDVADDLAPFHCDPVRQGIRFRQKGAEIPWQIDGITVVDMHDFGQPLARGEVRISPRSYFHAPTISQ